MVVSAAVCVDYGYCSALSRPADLEDGSLLFALDDIKSAKASPSAFNNTYIDVVCGVSEVEVAKRPASSGSADNNKEGPAQLLAVLEQAVLANVQRVHSNKKDAALLVASKLAEQGFHGQVVLESSRLARRHAASVPSMPFRPFLLVTAFTWGNVHSETRDIQAVVDLDFRAKFEITGASAPYAAATALLPEIYVGHSADLQAIVARMGRMLKKEFSAKGMALPPWRSTSALQGIWFPLDGRQGQRFVPTVLSA